MTTEPPNEPTMRLPGAATRLPSTINATIPPLFARPDGKRPFRPQKRKRPAPRAFTNSVTGEQMVGVMCHGGYEMLIVKHEYDAIIRPSASHNFHMNDKRYPRATLIDGTYIPVMRLLDNTPPGYCVLARNGNNLDMHPSNRWRVKANGPEMRAYIQHVRNERARIAASKRSADSAT